MLLLYGRQETHLTYRDGRGFAHPRAPRAFRRMRILIASSNTSHNGTVVYGGWVLPLLAARGHAVWLAADPDS